MSKQRRHFDGTQKVAILKRHLIDKVPVSDLCDELDLYPTQFYAWLKEFFENGQAAFDRVRTWSYKADIPVCRFLPWIGIGTSKFHNWKQRFGKVNEHNAWVPRDHWLTADEKLRICAFARTHPYEGYRRLTFMMLDADQVACSPASVYRVLKSAGLLAAATPNITKKGTGFVQPLKAHEHAHVDVSYLTIAVSSDL